MIDQLANNPFVEEAAGRLAIQHAWEVLKINEARMEPGGLAAWTDALYPLQLVEGLAVRGNQFWTSHHASEE